MNRRAFLAALMAAPVGASAVPETAAYILDMSLLRQVLRGEIHALDAVELLDRWNESAIMR